MFTSKSRKMLVVVDMQNDFITGALGTAEAQAIIPAIAARIKECRENGYQIVFTRDTHGDDYLDTQEGKFLPVVHCIKDTDGWHIVDDLEVRDDDLVFDKDTFVSIDLVDGLYGDPNSDTSITEIEFCGVCTDICVVSNALISKAAVPEVLLVVDANLCAGVTPELHKAALMVLQSCQVKVLNMPKVF